MSLQGMSVDVYENIHYIELDSILIRNSIFIPDLCLIPDSRNRGMACSGKRAGMRIPALTNQFSYESNNKKRI